MINPSHVGKMVQSSDGYMLYLGRWEDNHPDAPAILQFDGVQVARVPQSELSMWSPVQKIIKSDWITHRLPKKEDGYQIDKLNYVVLGIDSITGSKPVVKSIRSVEIGDPWLPITQHHDCHNCDYFEEKHGSQVCWKKGLFNPTYGEGDCHWKNKVK